MLVGSVGSCWLGVEAKLGQCGGLTFEAGMR